MKAQTQTQRRVSKRAVVVLTSLAVLGGTAATASAKDHTTCVINQDSNTNASGQQGICLVVPLPDVGGK